MQAKSGRMASSRSENQQSLGEDAVQRKNTSVTTAKIGSSTAALTSM